MIDSHFDDHIAVTCTTCKRILCNGPLPFEYATMAKAVVMHMTGDLQDAVKVAVKEIPAGSLFHALLKFRKH
jgi:hypothetical protein